MNDVLQKPDIALGKFGTVSIEEVIKFKEELNECLEMLEIEIQVVNLMMIKKHPVFEKMISRLRRGYANQLGIIKRISVDLDLISEQYLSRLEVSDEMSKL